MKFNTVKTTLAASAIGLAALLGTVEINAQSRDRGNNFPPVSNQRNDQQRIEIEKQRQRDEQIRAEQPRSEQIRMEQMRNQNGRDRNDWERNVRFKVYQNGKVFITDQRGLETLKEAVMSGYEKGFQAGQTNRRNKRRGNIYSQIGYQNDYSRNVGGFGYQNQVDSKLLQSYFQKGFQEGFEDGYNTRKMRGWGRDDVKISNHELRSILKFERF